MQLINRRSLLEVLSAAIAVPSLLRSWVPFAKPARATVRSRVRPGDPAWPSSAIWERLEREVGGRLVKVRSPLGACEDAPASAGCAELFQRLKNPYFLRDEAGLTQSLGWVGAWTSRPSAYTVAARTTGDVVAAVNFARENNLRLVVKGGGHSYHGASNSADSLLIWMRNMTAITVHDAFVGTGCAGRADPVPAVTVEAGAIWGQVYDAVTTQAGRYVQGGGCLTVGVAGLIQSGGFGNFSKRYGLAAASLLEAEVVTADGQVRIANACANPDLFWGLKGGGGGSLGVVTRLTLLTHELPEFFGAVFATIEASSEPAFRRLVGKVLGLYADALFNPHWGEQIAFRPGHVLEIAMVFQGLTKEEAETVWRPFFEWLRGSPREFGLISGPTILAVPARYFWDPEMLKQVPGVVLSDERPGAPASNLFWASNLEETGQVLHGYGSIWLPGSLLGASQQGKLADALVAATRHWGIALHVNKGLAGAPVEVVKAAGDTAMNPTVLNAFALAISGAEGPPAYPGIRGREPDPRAAREQAVAIGEAMGALRELVSAPGSYLAESDYFEDQWQQSFWGSNYPRLLEIKDKYDPDGLFFVHHGMGSEGWSSDGFTRLN